MPNILRNQRARRIFLEEDEPEPYKEALAVAGIRGDNDAVLKRLQRFRNDLPTNQMRGQIAKLLRSDSSRSRTECELNQIVKFANQLLSREAK